MERCTCALGGGDISDVQVAPLAWKPFAFAAFCIHWPRRADELIVEDQEVAHEQRDFCHLLSARSALELHIRDTPYRGELRPL